MVSNVRRGARSSRPPSDRQRSVLCQLRTSDPGDLSPLSFFPAPQADLLLSAPNKATSSWCTGRGPTRLDRRASPLTGPPDLQSDDPVAAGPLNPNSVAPAAVDSRHPASDIRLGAARLGCVHTVGHIDKTAGLDTRQDPAGSSHARRRYYRFTIKGLDADAIVLSLETLISRRFLSSRRLRACDGPGTCRQFRQSCRETPPRPRHRWK